MKKHFLLLTVQFAMLVSFAQPAANIASVYLYNPVKTEGAALVEIPTGTIATPGLIDWQNVHLEYDGKIIPFSIREGKAHWNASLKTPIQKPSPEDLVVFSVRARSREWIRVDIVGGSYKSSPALTRRGGLISISYPALSAVIDERTGMLKNMVAFGDFLLAKPMHSEFFEVGDEVVDLHGNMNPGNHAASLTLRKNGALETSSVQLTSWSSNDALTEVNFVLKYQEGVAVGLTYRVYSVNQVEIIIDERPWKNKSPWLRYGFKNELSLAGEKKAIDGFQTHFPYYGFKDYASAVSSTGTLHRGRAAMVFELGEESINGRFWKRRLAIFPANSPESEEDILDILDEGLVVKPLPFSSQPLPPEVSVSFPRNASAIGELLIQRLRKTGIGVKSSPEGETSSNITLILSENNSRRGITADGFQISESNNKIQIFAVTKFGLYTAVEAFIQSLTTNGEKKTAALISSNPVIDLRAGGFGGGPFEVDFPYGDDAEWKRALDGMMKSGMNSMTDLGMWSNWKMPVTFKYMPELQSDDPEAYDEVSGAKFSSFDSSRKLALNLLNYLQGRGVKVWLWVPVGAIPTTFEEKFPEATVPGKKKVPRFTHPAYRKYLESYFRELLETYPVDGFVLIRDDNGGIDDTEEFKKYLATSKTKDPVWEQYLVIHELLRRMQFEGAIAIYPYFDVYKNQIEKLIPEDLIIVGHGSGIATLTRKFETLGTMGDTWLDNLFAGFRVPAIARMKRLLSDRGSYWIGGAYYGTELSWQAIGYFGWQPSATVNSFRYAFGSQNFGEEKATDFISFSDASDHLWEIMNTSLFPARWFSFSDRQRATVAAEARRWLLKYRQTLEVLRKGDHEINQDRWFTQVALYGTYFSYHLERVELQVQMHNIALANLSLSEKGQLPYHMRKEILGMNDEIYRLASDFDEQAGKTPGGMIADLRKNGFTLPFREFVYGYEGYNTTLDQLLKVKQFDGQILVTTSPVSSDGHFQIEVELKNTGYMPWIKQAGHEIRLRGDASKLGLTGLTEFIEEPVVFGDRHVIVLKGIAPEEHGSGQIVIDFTSSFRRRQPIVSKTIELKW